MGVCKVTGCCRYRSPQEQCCTVKYDQIFLHSSCRLFDVGFVCPVSYRISCDFIGRSRLLQGNTEEYRTSPALFFKTHTPHHFRICVHLCKGLLNWSQKKVSDSAFLWMEAVAGQGWVRHDGDGGWGRGVRETQTPLDKLELQTVEIRMEPSLLYCDLKDRAGKDSPFTVQLPRQTPDAPTQPPTPLLFWFTFVWPELNRREQAKIMGLRFLWRMVYVHGVTGRARQRFCDDIIK